MPPVDASRVGAALAGYPELGPQLEAICRRESGCSYVGLHDLDARHGSAAWRNAVRVGWLDPQRCATHRRGEAARWSTTGAHGQLAAYSVRWLGLCAPPWVLRIPVVSAFAAARRAGSKRCGQVRRCASWRDA